MVHFAQELDQCHAYITALQSSCTQSSISAKENQKISDTYIKQRTPPPWDCKKGQISAPCVQIEWKLPRQRFSHPEAIQSQWPVIEKQNLIGEHSISVHCGLEEVHRAPSSSEKWHKVQRRPLARGSALISTETCPRGFYALLHSAQCTQHFKPGTARTLYLNHLFEADESIVDSVHLISVFGFINCVQLSPDKCKRQSRKITLGCFLPIRSIALVFFYYL